MLFIRAFVIKPIFGERPDEEQGSRHLLFITLAGLFQILEDTLSGQFHCRTHNMLIDNRMLTTNFVAYLAKQLM
jgi:hypothetical protein